MHPQILRAYRDHVSTRTLGTIAQTFVDNLAGLCETARGRGVMHQVVSGALGIRFVYLRRDGCWD
jgi:hypothetical protein